MPPKVLRLIDVTIDEATIAFNFEVDIQHLLQYEIVAVKTAWRICSVVRFCTIRVTPTKVVHPPLIAWNHLLTISVIPPHHVPKLLNVLRWCKVFQEFYIRRHIV